MSHHLNHKTNYQKTNRTIVAIIASLAVFVFGLILLTQPGKTITVDPVLSTSQLLAGETVFDFGSISMAKGKVSKIYKIKNPTEQNLTVSKLYTSCMCTQASLLQNSGRAGPFGMPGHGKSIPRIDRIINPGEEAEIEVIFDPAAHGPSGLGLTSREVYVETIDGGKLTLVFKAQVTP